MPQKVLAYLYKYSDMQVTFGVNMVAVAAGKPVLMGLKTVIGHFIRHQKNVVTRRTQYELDQAKARAHILRGGPHRGGGSSGRGDRPDPRQQKRQGGQGPRSMERFGFTDVQAQAILDLRLQRLTGLEIEALRKEYADVLKLISTLEGILHSEKKLLNVIKKELREISDQFGDDRRTELIHEQPEQAAPLVEEAPAPEDAVVFFTRGGQLRRMSPRFFEKREVARPGGGYAPAGCSAPRPITPCCSSPTRATAIPSPWARWPNPTSPRIAARPFPACWPGWKRGSNAFPCC